MDIFNIATLLGGLAFFLYGMFVMSSGLERIAGGKLEKILKSITASPFKSLLLGAGITIAIQSSSAMTVMLVGLVNSKIMELGQTVGVIMGSNIGTTLTAWILSLSGIESDVFWLRLLKPENFSPIVALIGVIMIMVSNDKKKKNIGSILMGFAILMFGMELMGNAVSPLAQIPEYTNLLIAFKNPILGVLVGTIFTGIIQSSAASVGILQALSLTGGISYGMAIPIIMGQNIGTCVTALISSIGVSKNAKKVGIVHISFNIIGTMICLIIFYTGHLFFNFNFLDNIINPVGIAAAHSLFNVFTTIILLPFSNQLVNIANLIIKDNEKIEENVLLDERLLLTPSVAINECYNLTLNMFDLSYKNANNVLELIDKYDQKKSEEIIKNEDLIDIYQDKIGTYLVKLTSYELSCKDSNKVSLMLNSINDFERIGDHALNILESVQKIHEKDFVFSTKAKQEMKVLTSAVKDILSKTKNIFENNDVNLIKEVEPLEDVIDNIVARIKYKHTNRLKNGECTIELGLILSDILGNCERISDHCSNIALAVLDLSQDNFLAHEYVKELKISNNVEFQEYYKEFEKQYQI